MSLFLKRRVGQSIILTVRAPGRPDIPINLTLAEINTVNIAKIAIDAPACVIIEREEIAQEVQK